MKRILLTLVMILSLGLSVQGVAAAQVDSAAEEDVLGLDISDIEGLTSAYGRTYMIDFMALLASPSADISLDDPSAFMKMIMVMGYSFDSPEHAQAFVETSQDEFGDTEDAEAAGVSDIIVTEIDDLGDGGVKVSMTIAIEDLGDADLVFTAIIFVDGSDVFMVGVMDVDATNADETATAVADFVLNAKVKSADVTFDEDGASTGGMFDRMPAAGDDVLGGLVPLMDEDLMDLSAN